MRNVLETHHDRVLGIFIESGNAMTGEEVVLAFKEKYGDNGTSDTIRTAVSALTRKGQLREEGTKVNAQGLTVKTWGLNDGPVIGQVTHGRQTPKQLQDEVRILEAKNKNLEETNMKLLGQIEALRDEVQSLHDDAAGEDL